MFAWVTKLQRQLGCLFHSNLIVAYGKMFFVDCANVLRCTANKKPKHNIHYSTILTQAGGFLRYLFSLKLQEKLQTKKTG